MMMYDAKYNALYFFKSLLLYNELNCSFNGIKSY